MKLCDILSLLPAWDSKYYIVKWMDKILFGEELEQHMYDKVLQITPEHNSYDTRSYILVELEPDIYWEANH